MEELKEGKPTPQELLYAELAKQEHIISADGEARLPQSKTILVNYPTMAIISVQAYNPPRRQYFLVEVPISKELFEDISVNVLFDFIMKEIRRFGNKEVGGGE